MTKSNSIITQKDILILRELLEDGRKSSASISKEIDLGREIVNYRIKRLIKENLIVKFIPKVNEEALGYKEYIILLKLNLEDEVSKKKFVKENIGNKYLIWIIKSNSGWDLFVRLYASSVDEFRLKLQEILENFASVLTNYYTIISSSQIKGQDETFLQEKLFSKHYAQDFKVLKHEEDNSLDEKDRAILELLESDARIQYKEIANELDISSDTVKYRIEKMKACGVIESIVPILNYGKLGFLQFAAILKFKFLSQEEEKQICDFLNSTQIVTKAIKSLNAEEFFLNIVCKTQNELENLEFDLEKKFSQKLDSFNFFNL